MIYNKVYNVNHFCRFKKPCLWIKNTLVINEIPAGSQFSIKLGMNQNNSSLCRTPEIMRLSLSAKILYRHESFSIMNCMTLNPIK